MKISGAQKLKIRKGLGKAQLGKPKATKKEENKVTFILEA